MVSAIGYHGKLMEDVSFMYWLMLVQKRINLMDEKTTNIWIIQAVHGHNSNCKKERNKQERRKIKLKKNNINFQLQFWLVKSLEIVTRILKIREKSWTN